MKVSYLLPFFLLSLPIGLVGEEYIIDFSESFGMGEFAESGVPLVVPSSVAEESNRRTLPKDARYIFKLPSSNVFVFDAHMGDVTLAYKDEGNAGRLVLYGNMPQYYLTVDEAYAVLSEFHEVFGVPSPTLDEWFKPIRDGKVASSFYQAGARTNYPRITIEAANSFFDKTPLFLNFIISFDKKSFKRMGLSTETNEVTNYTFDVPSIIKSVKAGNAASVAVPAIEEPITASRIVARKTTDEGGIEEVAQAEEVIKEAVDETLEGSLEQSSQWWLWLFGLLVVVGGIGLVVRSKNR